MKIHAQVGTQLDHALVVDRRVADFRDHVPLLQGIGRIVLVGRVHDHTLDGFIELEKLAHRGVLERLQVVIHRRFAVVLAVGDVLEKQLHLFVRDDIADVVVARELAEREADHLVPRDCRAAAIARIDRRIDLDAQARDRKLIRHEFDAGHDALGDG